MDEYKTDTAQTQGSSTHLRLSKEWDLLKDRFKLEKIIGSGACGVVVRAKDRANHRQLVAIKHVKASFKEGE